MVSVMILGRFMIPTYTSNAREANSFCKYTNYIPIPSQFNHFFVNDGIFFLKIDSFLCIR